MCKLAGMEQKLINYRNAISVPRKDLRWTELMFDPQLNGQGGIDPNGLVRKYPLECLRSLPEWLALACARISMTGVIIVQTWRNLIQNRRCIAWTREHGLCQSSTEFAETSGRPYYGISFLVDGSLRADRYHPADGLADDVRQFGGGVPVLWEGRVLTIEETVSEVIDFAHVWRLQVSTSQGTLAKDASAFAVLHQAFEASHGLSSAEASRLMMEAARSLSLNRPPLDRETGYPHNLVGVRADGGLVSLIAHGSLEGLAEMARAAGAVSAVVVDNGGSSALALRRSPNAELRPLVESYYHRVPSIAAAVYELEGEPETTFFTGAELPFAPVSQPELIGSRRRKQPEVSLAFDTDHGTVTRHVRVGGLDSEGADLVAVATANFAAIHGARSVAIVVAPPSEEFVSLVNSKFDERFSVTPRSSDPDGARGMWLSDYLSGIYDRRFSISGTLSESKVGLEPSPAKPQSEPVEYALGLDVGATQIKCCVLRHGKSLGEPMEVPTGLELKKEYNSAVLCERLRQVVKLALDAAELNIGLIQRVGVSWPGAVRNGIAATSKVLLDMTDMFVDVNDRQLLNRELFERLRVLENLVREQLNLNPECRVSAYNDGEVEAAFEAATNNRTGVLLCKLGGTVAGGFIDEAGDYRYLTELGRCVLRTDEAAPRHEHSKIRGWASLLIGSIAMARRATELGVSIDGREVSEQDAGRDLAKLIDAHSSFEIQARSIIDGMGVYVAELLIECEQNLGSVSHILLRGGPMADHKVGDLLRGAVLQNLPAHLRAKVDQTLAGQHHGAYAAGWLAARS